MTKYRFFILSLFPDQISDFLDYSILAKAQKNNLFSVELVNIRDFSKNAYKQVDDRLYGGGRGMLLKSDILSDALLYLETKSCDISKAKKYFMSPRGKTLQQSMVKELIKQNTDFIILCGHYEGVDQRFLDYYQFEELSIGDYVLTGGEIASIVFLDSLARLIKGVLPEEEAYTNESHYANLLEENQYTMPNEWNGLEVPKVLLSGNHKKINDYRRLSSMEVTLNNRPDLFDAYDFTREDYEDLSKFILYKYR